jgi:shikimate kinase
MIEKVVLIGMRGSGKSHFGTCLSKELNFSKIDIDDEIENLSHSTVRSLVEKKGWGNFRDWEYGVCKKISSLKNIVISTGGGTIMFDRNNEQLLKKSLVVFLFVPFQDLFNRLQKDKSRPRLLNGYSLKDEIKKIWEERKDKYFSLSDIVFTAKNNISKNKRLNVELNAKILAKKIRQEILKR